MNKISVSWDCFWLQAMSSVNTQPYIKILFCDNDLEFKIKDQN